MTSQKNNPSPKVRNRTFAADTPPSQICAQFAQDTDNVLDMLLEQYGLRYDRALARMLGVAPTVICKLRHGRMAIGPSILLRILEITDLSLNDLHQQLAHWRTRHQV